MRNAHSTAVLGLVVFFFSAKLLAHQPKDIALTCGTEDRQIKVAFANGYSYLKMKPNIFEMGKSQGRHRLNEVSYMSEPTRVDIKDGIRRYSFGIGSDYSELKFNPSTGEGRLAYSEGANAYIELSCHIDRTNWAVKIRNFENLHNKSFSCIDGGATVTFKGSNVILKVTGPSLLHKLYGSIEPKIFFGPAESYVFDKTARIFMAQNDYFSMDFVSAGSGSDRVNINGPVVIWLHGQEGTLSNDCKLVKK